jgi:hypothetical protein
MLKNNVLVNVQKILENHYFEKIEKKLDSFLSSDLLEKKIEKNNLFNKLLKLSFIDKISEILKSPDWRKIFWWLIMLLSLVYIIFDVFFILSGFLFYSNWIEILLYSLNYLLNILLFFVLFYVGYKIYFRRKWVIKLSLLWYFVTLFYMFFSIYLLPYLLFKFLSNWFFAKWFVTLVFNHVSYILSFLFAWVLFTLFFAFYLSVIYKAKNYIE